MGDPGEFDFANLNIMMESHITDNIRAFINLRGTDDISTVTRQSASGAEQMSATAEELNRQTESLRVLVGQFTLQETKTRAAVHDGGLSATRVSQKGHLEKVSTQSRSK